MPEADRPTLRPVTAPTVLTIGCSAQLEGHCAQAAESIGALFKRAKIDQAPTAVAERRPLVIVLTQDVYEFDPREFDALARDVGASLLRVEHDISAAVLEMLLGPALETAMARRQQQGAVIVGIDDPRLPPPSTRVTAPRRPAWMDSDAPPPSQPAGRA